MSKFLLVCTMLIFNQNIFAFEVSKESLNKAKELVKYMTLTQKIGQMTQAERQHASPEDVKKFGLGSILSGGGSNPTPNTPEAWKKMVKEYYEHSVQSATGIPLIYGVDAVHGQ